MAESTIQKDRFSHLTESQRQAIHTVDRSILVSAAAGSGKTTVLAERCAALVCDPPADTRCRVDELLVVTFTDAAAGEMRSRIRSAIKQRLSESPKDQHLQQQLHLLDSASISTIHAFCKTLIQRWFPQAQVDPQANVLSADEAELLRHEVLNAFFDELYAGKDKLSESFQALVEEYGGGNDSNITRVVLHLHQYISSLPDPAKWLSEAVQRVDANSPNSLCAKLDELQYKRLKDELGLQFEYCQHLAATIRKCWPIAQMHAEAIEQHSHQLKQWIGNLTAGGNRNWPSVAQQMHEFRFATARRRSGNLSDEEKADYDAAKELLDQSKELFKKRIQEPLCAFTAAEYREGFEKITPHVETLARLVTDFEQRYDAAKSAQAALDFNDLQRCAFRLLTDPSDPQRPSEVARQLQQQYRYVLVDEFQDIDPLQEAILCMVSRESADQPEGNLFAVGDIKQSIYRFRLAEPKLFSDRANEFESDSSGGKLIHLQENFRSRSCLIDAVNMIFRPLMRESFGGSDYDTNAELRTGASYPDASEGPVFDKPAVELHLLEPITESTRQGETDQDENGNDSANDLELEGIEREAFLIGRRIQQWMGDNPKQQRWQTTAKPETPGGPPSMRPIEYRDIVVLLRSLPHKAEPLANILRRMGIPAQVERGEAGFDSTEFRDCLSLLQVLDNSQQDIPLTAVLRSPLLGDRFNENDLLEIRLLDRTIPFHKAVVGYSQDGTDHELGERLVIVLAKLDRYRTCIQREPVAEILWDIYEENHYLAYVAGLPDGVRRREHLIQLHELARQFGHFSRQGLRRFLRFIEEMIERDRQPQQPATAGAEDNTVRIMTIHASKGLEFPVVILADLNKKFNLSDATGPVLVDRELGICMAAADPERRIFYPTLAQQLAAEQSRREDLSEELRVLYVALTRAREHLVLIGRLNSAKVAGHRARRATSISDQTPIPKLQLQIASNPLDWLLPAICSAPVEAVRFHDEQGADSALFKVFTHDRATTDLWRIPPVIESTRVEELAGLANLEPLPAKEPVGANKEAQQLVDALSECYPALELTTVPARISVSELKRRWDPMIDPDERSPRRGVRESAKPVFAGTGPGDEATRRGTATHRFLQHVDLSRPCDAADLKQQVGELIEAGRLTSDEADALMLEAATWFFTTELSQQIRTHANKVGREISFVSRISPDQYDPSLSPRDQRDVIMLRGTVDVLMDRESELGIIDYKTDMIDAKACAARAESYRAQIDNYAAALQSIYQRPVTNRWLVFLHARRIIDLAAAGS